MNNPPHADSQENQSIDVAFTDDDDETGLVPAHPAATLIIFHEPDGEGGSDESAVALPPILMVRRANTMAFAAGAAVFPGGRVDPDDHIVAQSLQGAAALAPADAAARVAAIRETLEETGLVVGLSEAALGPAKLMRAALLADEPFSAVLAEHGVSVKLDALTPFSRWRPNFAHARTFDTRFFITRMTGPLPKLDVVRAENSALFWIDAASALAQAAAGEMHIIFPTQRNLERLALYRHFADAHESTVQFPPRRITPWIAERDGFRHLCIRDDCGYPITSEPMLSAMRG